MKTPAFALCLVTAALPAAPLRAQAAPAAIAPLTLRMLFDSVAATHPLVRAAASRTAAARGARTTAGAFGNPVLTYQRENTPFPGGASIPGLNRETMTTAMLPLEPLYQRWPRISSADALVQAAVAEAQATRQRTALDAAGAFYRMAQAQVGVATARDLAAWLDSLVVYNAARVSEGAAAESDLLRSRLERDRADAEATMQEAELARARAALSAFVGDPRRAVALRAVAVSDQPLSLRPAAGDAPAAALRLDTRPEVRAARQRVEASSAALVGERTMILRQLSAVIGTKQTMGTTSMIAGMSLPFPIFDMNRGQVNRASAERDAATFELESAERSAAADLLGAREAAELLTARAVLLAAGGADGYLARADEARRIALGAYREGAVPLFQVLDAARAWGEARLTFTRTLHAQHESVLALLLAQGVDLFTNLPAPAEPAAPNR